QREFVAQLLHHLGEPLGIALLGPALLGAHLEPAELDRVGLIAHLAGRDLDYRAFLGRQRGEHLAFQVLEEARLEVNIDLHCVAPSTRASLDQSATMSTLPASLRPPLVPLDGITWAARYLKCGITYLANCSRDLSVSLCGKPPKFTSKTG